MPKSVPPDDPTYAYARNATAARSVGISAHCSCGETRPEALIRGSKPTTCFGCARKQRGYSPVDNHHVAGEANSPATLPVPASDHCAVLSVAQYNWPRETLENPDGCPLRAAAACIRGFIDYIYYAVEKHLLWIPEMLETLSTFLADKLGRKWWHNTPLDRFSPKHKRRKRNGVG
jgi:hypothetical protein